MLHANGSLLTSLPASLATLEHLERANFSDNDIEKLPLALQEKWSDALVAVGKGSASGGDGETEKNGVKERRVPRQSCCAATRWCSMRTPSSSATRSFRSR